MLAGSTVTGKKKCIGYKSRITEQETFIFHICRGVHKSLARPGRIHANVSVRMA